jgi:hypothetical protein
MSVHGVDPLQLSPSLPLGHVVDKRSVVYQTGRAHSIAPVHKTSTQSCPGDATLT